MRHITMFNSPAVHIAQWLSVILLLMPLAIKGANILCLFPHASESHFAVMRSVAYELARRNHNVTLYSSHRLTEPAEKITEKIIEPEYPFWTNLQKYAGVKNGLAELSELPPATLQKALGAIGAASMDYYLSNNRIKELLSLTTEEFTYDLIILDHFYTDAFLALGKLHQKPTIAIVSTDFEDYMQHVMESFVPSACSPIDFVEYVKGLGFWERVQQIRACIARRKIFDRHHLAAQEALIQKHMAHFSDKGLPTVGDLHSELAVLLFNNHVPLLTPRPMLQNTILAGGLHIRQARELPWFVRRYLDEARAGVIYMNLGNEQHCAEIPKTRLQVLYEAFNDTKVLWTCHDEEKMKTEIPKNWKVQHMVPQTDILAHPHVKVFIMNGDLLNLQEGIVRLVPMIGLPIFRHEKRNMQLAVKLNVAIQFDESNLTAEGLEWAYKELRLDRSYATEIRVVSQAFRDRPLGALETSMYWIDYVLRHNGGADIKTRGVGIGSSQLHLFDLFVYYFGVAFFSVFVVGVILFAAIVVWNRRTNTKIYSKLN